jgi:hypothetical protein
MRTSKKGRELSMLDFHGKLNVGRDVVKVAKERI